MSRDLEGIVPHDAADMLATGVLAHDAAILLSDSHPRLAIAVFKAATFCRVAGEVWEQDPDVILGLKALLRH